MDPELTCRLHSSRTNSIAARLLFFTSVLISNTLVWMAKQWSVYENMGYDKEKKIVPSVPLCEEQFQ